MKYYILLYTLTNALLLALARTQSVCVCVWNRQTRCCYRVACDVVDDIMHLMQTIDAHTRQLMET